MTENDNNKVGIKFWIGALAVSVLLLAITFAAMAVYLGEIKNNTIAALARTDIVTEQLNALNAQVTAIHHQLVEEKAAANPAPAPATPAPEAAAPVTTTAPAPVAETPAPAPAPVAPLVKDVTPPSVPAALPAIQAPTLPAPTPAPAPAPAATPPAAK